MVLQILFFRGSIKTITNYENALELLQLASTHQSHRHHCPAKNSVDSTGKSCE